MRMSSERFRHLLSLLEPKICKQDTALCRAIPPAERLALTLRFLATEDEQQSLGFFFSNRDVNSEQNRQRNLRRNL